MCVYEVHVNKESKWLTESTGNVLLYWSSIYTLRLSLIESTVHGFTYIGLGTMFMDSLVSSSLVLIL